MTKDIKLGTQQSRGRSHSAHHHANTNSHSNHHSRHSKTTWPQSSKQNTQQIILSNREVLRLVEDKSILERQVEEYKSTLLNQSQLIRSLRGVIEKQQIRIE